MKRYFRITKGKLKKYRSFCFIYNVKPKFNIYINFWDYYIDVKLR